MNYSIQILPRAERQLAALDRTPYGTIKAKINALASNPRPPGCQKLKDRPGWRVRAGDYRILYDIDDAIKIVAILEVGHRREIYR
ncbi:MAG TPA: type II toxin-antitoxin system RelE/ParE family toxin [Candidatus Acidoferrum sp.]